MFSEQLIKHFKRVWLACCVLPFVLLQTNRVFAQYEELEETPVMEKILTSPFVTLLVVLVGSTGMFNYFFASGKGERSDKQSLTAIICFILVVLLVWYRFSLWTERSHR